MVKLKNKKIISTLIVSTVLGVLVYLAWPAGGSQPTAKMRAKQQSISSQPVQFNKNLYPIDTADSIWAVVNKGRALPASYTPPNLRVPSVPLRASASSPEMLLRDEAAAALEAMFGAARAQGVQLKLESGYRSYSLQTSVYGSYAAESGAAKADTFSARPGHSEHQTGLAADIEPIDRTCEVEQCFENTPEGRWLSANAYSYGFIIRYQKTTQSLTGYEYEPWHIRFVGKDLASQIAQSGQTLEQFFDLPAYTSYPANSLELKE